MNLPIIEKVRTKYKNGLKIMSAHIGKLPSVFFPSSIGRLIRGCEASETKTHTSDAYKNGIANNLNPMFLNNINNTK